MIEGVSFFDSLSSDLDLPLPVEDESSPEVGLSFFGPHHPLENLQGLGSQQNVHGLLPKN